jgi:hypothetical protein
VTRIKKPKTAGRVSNDTRPALLFDGHTHAGGGDDAWGFESRALDSGGSCNRLLRLWPETRIPSAEGGCMTPRNLTPSNFTATSPIVYDSIL